MDTAQEDQRILVKPSDLMDPLLEVGFRGGVVFTKLPEVSPVAAVAEPA